MSQRHVRRSNVRPTYTRRPAARPKARKRFELPVVEVAWIKLAAAGVGVLMVFIVIANLTSLESVRVEGATTLNTQEVKALSEKGVQDQFFGRNTLLVNTSGVASYLEKTDPAIKEANVRRDFPHGIVVKVTERQPTLNWKVGDSIYLLDNDATVIAPTPAKYAKLPVVTDTNNVPVKTGERVAPTSFVVFAGDIAKQLPAAGFGIQEMQVPVSTSELHVVTDKGIMIKFDTTRPAGEAITDLGKVQRELQRVKKAPKEYIDLRIAGKAYYK